MLNRATYLKDMFIDDKPKPVLCYKVKIDKYELNFVNDKVVRIRADSFENPRYTEGLLSSSFKEEILTTTQKDKKILSEIYQINLENVLIETQIDRH